MSSALSLLGSLEYLACATLPFGAVIEMTLLIWSLLFTIPFGFAGQREIEKWQRAYTGEDMVIDLDVSNVTFVENNVWKKMTFAKTPTGRVRFRTSYSKFQPLKEDPSKTFKTQIETFEFNCGVSSDDRVTFPGPTRSYRLFDATLLDQTGRTIKSLGRNPAKEWKEVRFGSMMDKLAAPACRLIAEKRRHP